MKMTDSDADINLEREVLRESIRSRCDQTLPGAVALFATLLFILVLLVGQVPTWTLLAWYLPLVVGIAWRIRLARKIGKLLAYAGGDTLKAFDRTLHRSSMLNQAVCGAGIWEVAPYGTETIAFFVTLAIAMFGIGAMINLASSERSFRYSLPLLMGQPVAYWLLSGADGLRIAMPLVLLSILMLSLVRGTAKTFAESVQLRFQKDEALKLAQDAMRARALFLAAASHDLRQPLYAISILADAMALENLPSTTGRVLEKQREAIGVLRVLFDNLLDLSRFDAKEVKPALRQVALHEILGTVANEYETLCAAKGLQWTCAIPKAWVRTDPELFRRLVGNLLSNAVRYTPSGGVTLTARMDGPVARLTIADTGIGIAQEDQLRIFEEFVQLDNRSRDRERGVGLGLSIVRRINDLLDAKLELSSAPGRGTSITFELPAADAPSVSGPAAQAAGSLDYLPLAGMRVWVVDDDKMVHDALGTLFCKWDLDHAFVASKSELAELKQRYGEWPDAVILDDMLGQGEQGLEIARWLGGQMDPQRIVLVTGNVDARRGEMLAASGFRLFRKPVVAIDLAEWLLQRVPIPRNPEGEKSAGLRTILS